MVRLIGLIILTGISLNSVYVFPSGLPQPSDFVLAFFVLVTFTYSLFRGGVIFLALPLVWLIFVLWIFLVCFVWALIMQDGKIFTYFAFYVYNYLVAACLAYIISQHAHISGFIRLAVHFALIISGIGVLFSLGWSGRATGFFNNPNQLAYFSLLGIAILLVTERFQLKTNPISMLAISSGIGGIFAAASLGAMAGFALVVAAYVVANLSAVRLLRAALLVSVISILVASLDFSFVSEIEQNLEKRFLLTETKVEGMSSERNYDRIVAYPQYVLFGAGEGYLERFAGHDELEIHSSPGTILFSYGLVGMLLFMALLYSVFKAASFPVWLLALGIFLYSMTHMGLRSTFFWIFLVVVWKSMQAEGNQVSASASSSKDS